MKNATIIGTAIGDALGMPWELKKYNNTDLLSWDGDYKYGSFLNLQAGQTTDDTAMTVALARSLIEANGYDPVIAAKHYLAWFTSPSCCGTGGTTRKAMANLQSGITPDCSGISGREIGGNGTAMRAAPIGVWYRNDIKSLISAAEQDAVITHNSDDPIQGSISVALAVGLLASKTVEKHNLLTAVLDYLPSGSIKVGLNVVRKVIAQNVFSDVAFRIVSGPKCYVVDTIMTAFYGFLRFPTFEQSLIEVIKSGGDTDTNAAICGALAGTYYGLEVIPPKYVDGVENNKDLLQIDQYLWSH